MILIVNFKFYSSFKLAIVNEKGFDVFGFNTNQIKKQCECICPTCQRPISAQRFAPHLEKCMGMGMCCFFFLLNSKLRCCLLLFNDNVHSNR